jgi:ATP-dependent DNA helicase RecG
VCAQIASSAPVSGLKGVGPRLAEKLARLDIRTHQDLLLHLPARYQDRTRIAPIGSLRPGEEAAVEGVVQLARIRAGRRRMLLVYLSDGTGALLLRFFHFTARQQQVFTNGVRLRCYGEVRGAADTPEIIHPEYQLIGDEPVDETPALTPVYPATAGLHQATLRSLIFRAVDHLDGPAGERFVPELLPPDLLSRYRLAPLRDALLYIHRPPPDAPAAALAEGLHPLRKRLAFEELLAHQLGMRVLHAEAAQHGAPVLAGPGELGRRFLAGLPFELTAAQRRVIADIERDLRRPHPMQRLVQGDVGSGKTVVAAAALLVAVESGCQAAIMAPTELLAEQHYRNVDGWLRPLGVKVGWLSGKSKGKSRQQALDAIKSGAMQVAVGTHALFQQEVTFSALGLVIVDEQHRFGVHQRLALREKGRRQGRYPHQLIMTATPIPRTLMMTAYADLDCSIIDELPPGRQPVTTVVVPDTRRDEVLQRVRSVCVGGRQAYWVCTLIEESEALQCQAAIDTAAHLAAALPELSVGLVHGRLKPAEKEAVMAGFKAGEIDLLVATTVIEVGVDVPNASLMIIENAERLGLAQLHQLRGRIGRGSEKSACVLMYHSPLSERGRERLAVLRETADGFEIARRDLDMRGPGEILGVRQAGLMRLRIADLQRDGELIAPVSEAAGVLLARFPEAAAAIMKRWFEGRPQYSVI